MPDESVDGFFDRPRRGCSAKAVAKHIFGNARMSGKVCERENAALVGEQEIGDPVVRLLATGGPTDIPRLVVAVIVDPVERRLVLRPLADVGEETLETRSFAIPTSPTAANCDAAFFVVDEARIR